MNTRNFIGIILIIIGIGFLLGQFNVWNFTEIIAVWWPSIIIALGIYRIATDRPSLWFGLLVFIFGAMLQADHLDLLPWGFWNSFWPVLLIFAGIWLITSRLVRDKNSRKKDNILNDFYIFSGAEQRIETQNFQGGTITALFGGAELDLRNSKIIEPEINLEMNAIFGGIELVVPEEWIVKVSGLPLFGGLDNKTKKSALDDERIKPVIKIKYLALFGGIEIKN
jgi:predicted membrane protein